MMRWFAPLSLLVSLLTVSGCAVPEPSPSALSATDTEPALTGTTSPSPRPTVTATAQQGSPEATTTPSAASPPLAATASQIPTVISDAPLVNLFRHGGLCATGYECQWQMVIYQSGGYSIGSEVGPAYDGVLNAAQMAELRYLVEQTDFEAIRAVTFTELCPIAYDGQESIYTFYTSHGEEVLSSCERQIDTNLPLFRWIEELIAELIA